MRQLMAAVLLAPVLAGTGPVAAAPPPLAADTPMATVAGNTFIAPAGWRVSVRGPATLLEAPEGGSWIGLVDVQAADAEQAVAEAWKAYPRAKKWPLKVVTPSADRDGWSQIRNYDYQTSPNEKRGVSLQTRQANGKWTVAVYDMADAVGEKRGAQLALIFGQLLPKGYQRESFAGKRAHALDAQRVAALGRFVERAQGLLGVPGVSVGLIQDGKVVFAGGYGARALGTEAKVDADTMYMIASNTKALTTLMLGKLVDEKKVTWETPATALLPSFKLGDADTTRQVLVKHLICACTGLPRQDMEWLLQYAGVTPEGALATLGTMQPTSRFGELFQYSNPLAAAAGFVGGHVAFPDLEIGAAYDRAMQTRVFDPLGMRSTTFDYAAAQQGNFASPHAPDVDGKTAPALMESNYSIIPVRPAGAAWSTVRDLLRYVQMEIDLGRLPDGSRYIERETLLARRAPQVSIGKDTAYGMGLFVETRYGVTVVHHGGDMIGFHSDMMWLPEHGVGAVVLTNGDPGWVIRTQFRRKLLEVLFDGKPEADAAVDAAAKSWFDQIAADRKLLTVPADAAEAGKLAPLYVSGPLGEIAVRRAGASTVFDFGEWKSEVASRRNPDGTISFVTIVPGMGGLELVVGAAGGKRTLTLRDAQHEYVFVEKAG
jgi:CubicO group peptidase (beta-lactamase class C family)